MDWNRLIEKIATQIVRIEGDRGSRGTGFLLGRGKLLRTIATARHVFEAIAGKPATICHTPSGKRVRVGKGPGLRNFLIAAPGSDLDVALFFLLAPELPQPTVPILEQGHHVQIGTEVGWLGYPGLTDTLCFFSGRISAVLPDKASYLIDGVAIPGVSGGPVFCETSRGLRLIGSISGYTYGTRKTGPSSEHSLPGLAIANDVSWYNTVEITEQDVQHTGAEADHGTPSEVTITVKNTGKPPPGSDRTG